MKDVLSQRIPLQKILISTCVVCIGLLGLLFGPPTIGIFSLTVTGLLAFHYSLGKAKTHALFSKPVRPIKYVGIFFLLNWLLSLLSGALLTYGFGWHLQSNPVNDRPTLLLLVTVPIMIMGEELFSIYFLSLFSSRITLLLANLFSAIVFGLVHFSTYYNGNPLKTIVHVLLIQGTARLLFNTAAIKSNSIWTSWIIHVLFDLSSIYFVFLHG
ncbi:CPBP family intramembrane glutamic endopeptidase [Enterococcus florum]|uniref:CPBP family intramembrane glutamic endopeptidase n=1 Tax=Enterococcus florum TaxID=2480627 RepID=UPI0011BA96DB|nr:CPBP family intramembrane glutamic endopeptidase [Enterococcus florum]